MIIAIFKIDKGFHYITCNSLADAAERIKSKIDSFYWLLPKVSLPEQSTGEQLTKKCKDLITLGRGMNKKKFLKLMKD